MDNNKFFDDELIIDFMRSFYGYGDINADFWFIGMEEGGGNSFEEVRNRLNIWEKMGRNQLENVKTYHDFLGFPEYFAEKPKAQSTWTKLIRVYLASQGDFPGHDQIKKLQRDEFGIPNSNVALLELLPLPSPSTNKWIYSSHSEIPYLKSRKKYRNHLAITRLNKIQKMIIENRPKAVILYGFSYFEYWEILGNSGFMKYLDFDFWVKDTSSTKYIIMKHPVAFGLKNEYFNTIGTYLKEG
jgi:hypothetical protein